jgi:mono/diheme cytochrome c family protein
MIRRLLAVTILATATAALADEAATGERIVKGRCISCHNLDKLKQYASRTPEQQRAPRWEKFLPTHNVPDAVERRAVIAYLTALTAE